MADFMNLDENLYSRQIAVYGKSAMNSLTNAKVLILGFDGTCLELCKNLILAGVGTINVIDSTVINIEEGSEFGVIEVIVDQEKQIAFNVFDIEHTFQAPGTYIVRFNEKNRNAGVLNMDNSVDTPFYIETRLLIDPFLGSNNTPVFLVPPVDEGAVGVRFIHNPGAFDIDGDSLSFRLVVPKQFKDREVTNYADPNDPKFYASNFSNGNEDQNGPPTFSIDAITGDLEIGAFNV